MGLGLSVGVQDFGAVGPVVVCVGGVVVDDDDVYVAVRLDEGPDGIVLDGCEMCVSVFSRSFMERDMFHAYMNRHRRGKSPHLWTPRTRRHIP